jgi:hypothetical protein
MEEFALVFRQPSGSGLPTPEQNKEMRSKWDNWIGDIAAQGKYIGAKRLAYTGKVLKASGVITDGPFVEIKEQLGGFISVRAENIDEATTLAHGCPIFLLGGNVEIRQEIPSNS